MSTILIVDDEPEQQLLLSIFIKKFGYDVVAAENGLKGLEQVAKTVPDLIVTDVMMPQMDGFEMIRAIKKDERWSELPIIISSAIDIKDRFEIEVDAYIRKPVNFSDLRDLLANVLASHRPH